MYLNANIPPIECYVRGNFLRDQKDSHDKYFECVVFGFTSIPKQVPLFHYMMTDGGIWWRAPISAFCKKPGVKELPLNENDNNKLTWLFGDKKFLRNSFIQKELIGPKSNMILSFLFLIIV